MASLTESEHNLVGLSILIIGLAGLYINKSLYDKVTKKTEPNKVLINMIIVNVALIIMDFPFPIISSFGQKWVFSDAICTYYGSSSLVFGFNSMLCVVMLSLDQLFDKKYENYETWKTQARSYMIGYTWVNCLFWGLAPVFGWSRIGQELTRTSCTLDFVNADASYRSYIMSCFVVIFIVPVFAMLYCALSKSTPISKDKAYKFAENDKIILLLAMLFIFVWTPYTICYLWPVFGNIKNLSIRFNAAAPVIAKLCTITTPLIYLLSSDSKKIVKSQ